VLYRKSFAVRYDGKDALNQRSETGRHSEAVKAYKRSSSNGKFFAPKRKDFR